MAETKKRVYSPKVETRLTRADITRLDESAKTAKKNRSDFVRQALLWYLDNLEKLEHDQRETEVAKAMKYATDQHVKAINSGVDRICKMLARQGAAIGTLYELSWMALPDDENAKMAFEAAGNTAKQKMRKHVERDEAELSEKMKKVVTSK
jgi:Arc/MetJ-type ribon-helix-helix transcriptional regulator